MSSIIIFIVILVVLILVHELGHFFIARLFGIRVDEFGFGYPPRAVTLFSWRRTRFTLNWLPFGGFVKIFGENGEEPNPEEPDAEKSFVKKPKYVQALVLLAGVSFNLIFAWVLISAGFMVGLPTSTSTDIGEVKNAKLVITSVTPNSPANEAGLQAGDVISQIIATQTSLSELSPIGASDFISGHGNEKLKVSYVRGEEVGTVEVVPKEGIVEGRKAIGISMDMIGKLTLPIHRAFIEGAKSTFSLTKLVVVGLVKFVYDSVRGVSDLAQITGPVGIVGLVGDASQLGFIYLLSFTAFISINLAVINMIPFPALDGGRLLFVIIESIKRSPISPKVANAINAVGFVALIILMVFVTVHDIIKLV